MKREYKKIAVKIYLKNKKRHRIDGPAVISGSGYEFWYKNGILDRDDGPAFIDKIDYYEAWYKDNELHRLDGPAETYSNGNNYWYKNGVLHREEERQ